MCERTMRDYLLLRSRPLNKCLVNKNDSDYVLCWLTQTLRSDDNPVLDAAILMGIKLDKPVLVYHGLDDNYLYASDRLFSFILQASCSLEKGVIERGLRFHRYVQQDGKTHLEVLYELARRASSIVVDDVAAFPSRVQMQLVAGKVSIAMLAVEGQRLVPDSALEGMAVTTREFRDKSGAVRKVWLAEPSGAETDTKTFDGDLATEHVALSSESAITTLIQNCNIDHTLWPVNWCTGYRTSALDQLEWAKDNVLPHYSAARNNAADPLSVSRLSPYLHFGVLSPKEVVHTVLEADLDSRPRWKFLDELLTWREYFHHIMANTMNIGSYQNAPSIGRATLEAHRNDPREVVYSLSELARGETADETWNAAQKQYVLEGWMHNNLRMYWGKKIIGWTKTPEEAWATACYLNDRFSLDGRDPATYGNMTWCFSAKPGKGKVVYGTVPMKTDRAMRKRQGMPEWLAELAAKSIPTTLKVPNIVPRRK